MTLQLGRYFWKLFLVNAALMAGVLAGCVWVIMLQFDRIQEEELSRHLLAEAGAIEVAVRNRFERSHADELNALANHVGSAGLDGVRITFVLADGTVLGDSEANPATMESHSDRPEIRAALKTGAGESVRWSHTVSKRMKYVAVRVGTIDDPRGVVRVSMAVQSIAARAEPAQRLIMTIAGTSALAGVLLASALALLWSRRIRRITDTASTLSRGDLSARIDVIGHDEVALLGRSLNYMRERLAAQLETIDRQRRTLDSLVSQLREGVVVADADGRIILINAEAIALLQLTTPAPGGSLLGLTVEQCVPRHELQNLLRHTTCQAVADADVPSRHPASDSGAGRSETQTQELELRLATDAGTRTLLVRAFDVRLPALTDARLASTPARHIGRAIVLTDVTQLTKVMQVKADLAANASHELRTPLSAIRAAVDTLRSIDWSTDAAAAARFVDVVDRHSARMEALIGDLLDLSRLESGSGRFDRTTTSARALFEDIRTTFADAVASRNLHWKASVAGDDITWTVSAELLRMILRNLTDNAIRFTPPGGNIDLSARCDGEAVVLEVADTGCGIPPEEHERIFERFYQVERARSGPHRGTGLGLSIVRHAVAALDGRITLESAPGRGTRVTIRIPRRRDP
ncbi:MAG: ATP-binding protein [Phycisphaerae bacterium]